MFSGANRHKDGHAGAKLLRVQQGDTLFDIALGLKPLDALPAGIGGEIDALRHLDDRERSVLLQDAEQPDIVLVEGGDDRQ
jgi:hypothetical protein